MILIFLLSCHSQNGRKAQDLRNHINKTGPSVGIKEEKNKGKKNKSKKKKKNKDNKDNKKKNKSGKNTNKSKKKKNRNSGAFGLNVKSSKKNPNRKNSLNTKDLKDIKLKEYLQTIDLYIAKDRKEAIKHLYSNFHKSDVEKALLKILNKTNSIGFLSEVLAALISNEKNDFNRSSKEDIDKLMADMGIAKAKISNALERIRINKNISDDTEIDFGEINIDKITEELREPAHLFYLLSLLPKDEFIKQPKVIKRIILSDVSLELPFDFKFMILSKLGYRTSIGSELKNFWRYMLSNFSDYNVENFDEAEAKKAKNIKSDVLDKLAREAINVILLAQKAPYEYETLVSSLFGYIRNADIILQEFFSDYSNADAQKKIERMLNKIYNIYVYSLAPRLFEAIQDAIILNQNYQYLYKGITSDHLSKFTSTLLRTYSSDSVKENRTTKTIKKKAQEVRRLEEKFSISTDIGRKAEAKAIDIRSSIYNLLNNTFDRDNNLVFEKILKRGAFDLEKNPSSVQIYALDYAITNSKSENLVDVIVNRDRFNNYIVDKMIEVNAQNRDLVRSHLEYIFEIILNKKIINSDKVKKLTNVVSKILREMDKKKDNIDRNDIELKTYISESLNRYVIDNHNGDASSADLSEALNLMERKIERAFEDSNSDSYKLINYVSLYSSGYLKIHIKNGLMYSESREYLDNLITEKIVKEDSKNPELRVLSILESIIKIRDTDELIASKKSIILERLIEIANRTADGQLTEHILSFFVAVLKDENVNIDYKKDVVDKIIKSYKDAKYTNLKEKILSFINSILEDQKLSFLHSQIEEANIKGILFTKI